MSCRVSCTTKADCFGIAECFSGACGGLLGTYFATESLMGRSVARVDRSLDFYFQAAPVATIPAELFSVRWTGKIVAPISGTYSFAALIDDGARLWIDDQLIIDDWDHHPPQERTGQIALTGGKPVSIKLEYVNVSGEGTLRLSWATIGLPKQIVAATSFRPE